MCLSVSVTSRCSIKAAERIGLVFCMEAFFDLSHTALDYCVLYQVFEYMYVRVIRKFKYLQNKGTSLRNFAANSGHRKISKLHDLNSGLRKCRHGMSIVERAMNLARERRTLGAFLGYDSLAKL